MGTLANRVKSLIDDYNETAQDLLEANQTIEKIEIDMNTANVTPEQIISGATYNRILVDKKVQQGVGTLEVNDIQVLIDNMVAEKDDDNNIIISLQKNSTTQDEYYLMTESKQLTLSEEFLNSVGYIINPDTPDDTDSDDTPTP